MPAKPVSPPGSVAETRLSPTGMFGREAVSPAPAGDTAMHEKTIPRLVEVTPEPVLFITRGGRRASRLERAEGARHLVKHAFSSTLCRMLARGAVSPAPAGATALHRKHYSLRPVPGRRAPGRASISHRARPGDETLASDEAQKKATAYGDLPLRSARPQGFSWSLSRERARASPARLPPTRAPPGARQWVEHASTRPLSLRNG